MRMILFVGSMALFVLATASTGSAGTADMTFLEGATECHASSSYENEHGGNETTWWWHATDDESRTCTDDRTVVDAAASDDQGVLGRAYVTESENNKSSDHYDNAGSSTGSSDNHHGESQSTYEYTREEAWSRDAGVETTAGSLTAGRGCREESRWAGRTDSDFAGDEDGFTGHGEGPSGSRTSNRCGTTIEASHAGRSAGLRLSEGDCSYSSNGTNAYDYESDRTGDSSTFSYSSDSTRTSDCRLGLSNSGVGGPGFGGWESSCDSTDSYLAHHSRNGANYTSETTSTYHDDCFSGVAVEGADGARLEAGERSTYDSNCTYTDDEETCDDSFIPRYGGRFDWDNNPAGPTNIDAYWFATPEI